MNTRKTLDDAWDEWAKPQAITESQYKDSHNPLIKNNTDNFERELRQVTEEIIAVLLEKNRKYGDAALNPIRVFSKQNSLEQINVRLDDKLSRMANRQNDEDEDVDLDILGYMLLKQIAKKRLTGNAK